MNPNTTIKYPSQAAEDAVEKYLNDHFGYYTVSDAPVWRIKWRGKVIKVNSGKSSWPTEGRAKSAFKNHIKRTNLTYWYERNVTLNDALRWKTMSDADFYKIIEGDVQYVQG